MKFNYSLALSVLVTLSLFTACKKKDGAPLPDVYTPASEPLILGMYQETGATSVKPGLWDGNKQPDAQRAPFMKTGTHITVPYGMYKRLNNGIGGKFYYGISYAKGQNKTMIAYWSEREELLLSEATGKPMREEFYSHATTDSENSLLIFAWGWNNGDETIAYYYKIAKDGTITHHLLPNITRLSEGGSTSFNGYSRSAVTKTGVFAIKYAGMEGKTYIAYADRGNLKEMFLDNPAGEQKFQVRSSHIDENNNFYMLGVTEKTANPVTVQYYLVRVKAGSETPERFPVQGLDNYIKLMQGTADKDKLYIPGGSFAKNEQFYYTIQIPGENATSVTATKVTLEADPAVTIGEASIVLLDGKDIFVAGVLNKLNAYWKNGKIRKLDSKDVVSSYPYFIYRD